MFIFLQDDIREKTKSDKSISSAYKRDLSGVSEIIKPETKIIKQKNL